MDNGIIWDNNESGQIMYIYINMLATLEQIFLPHKSEGIGIGTGTTLFGSFALNLSLLSPMRKLRVSIELEPSH